MTQFLLILGTISFGLVSLFGWGAIVRRLCRSTSGLPWPVEAGTGIGAVLVLGGLANLAGIAVPLLLDTLAVLGLLAAGWEAFRSRRNHVGPDTLVRLALAVAVLCFVALYLAPARAFNFHDDFEKYLPQPLRMLAMGTLAGNPLDAVGLENLGGQAFLQAFALAHLPAATLALIDLGLGLALCLLILGFAWRGKDLAILGATLLAQLTVLAINPHYVNASTLFLGAAMVMAAIRIPADFSDRLDWKDAARLGLVYSGMVALKPHYALFAALHLLSLLAIRPGAWRLRLPGLAKCAVLSLIFLSPWLALHARMWMSAGTLTGMPLEAAPPPPGLSALFSASPLFYGDSPLHFTLLALAVLLIFPTGLMTLRRSQASPQGTAAAAGAVAGGGAFVLLVAVLAVRTVGMDTALRLAIPLLIGSLPMACLLLLEAGPGRPVKAGVLGVLGIVVLAFAPGLAGRVEQAARWGNLLAFPMGKDHEYLAFNNWTIDGKGKERIATAQRAVPPGEPVIAWISAPFTLDFHRNPVYTVNPAGLSTPWAHWPAASYVIWEYKGYGVRSPEDYQSGMRSPEPVARLHASHGLAFALELRRLAASGRILYHDGSLVVFRKS